MLPSYRNPGLVRGKLKEVGGELIYGTSTQHPRISILVEKGFQILPLMHHCYRDLTTVKIKTSSGGTPRKIILGSDYLPYDGELPPPGELEKLVMACRAGGTHLIAGCDTNWHHTSWRNANTKTEVSPCLIILWLTDWT
jgi:hypothetical protein